MTALKFLPDSVRSPVRAAVSVMLVLGLVACSSPRQRAPVEDKSPAAARPAAPATPAKVLPGAENAGKPGYYTVKPGDTLARVAVETGQNWRDIARWNNIANPNLLEVGQVLRVVRPGVEPAVPAAAPSTPSAPGGVAVAAVGSTPGVEVRPLDAKSATAPAPAAAASAAPAAAPAPPAAADEELTWNWPASGALISGFDEARSKGLVIAGQAGDAVLAAADGRVVYVGSALRGYGNMVIIKHNDTFLSAYAHNHAIVVKEGQVVRRGQKVAEMGSSDAPRVQLYFEVRRNTKPVDPAKVLPPR